MTLLSAVGFGLALALAVAPRLGSETPWWLAVISYLPPLLLGLFALCTLGSGFRDRSRPAVLLSLLTLFLAAMLASWGLHVPGDGRFRLVSLNLGTWSADVDGAGEALARVDADVLMLQEVWGPEHAQWLARHFPGWAWARPEQAMDLLILSRYPLRDVRKHEGESLEMLAAAVELPGVTLRLTNVHLRNPFRSGNLPSMAAAWLVHGRQIDYLEQHLHAVDGPAVVAGDFNAPARSPRLNPVPAGYIDAFASAGIGPGNTFPAWLPLWRIDYVWYSGPLRAVSARTLRVDACDHRAVVVDLTTD